MRFCWLQLHEQTLSSTNLQSSLERIVLVRRDGLNQYSELQLRIQVAKNDLVPKSRLHQTL